MYSLIAKRMAADSMLSLKVSRVMGITNIRFASGPPLKEKEKGDEKVYFSKGECKFYFYR